MCVQNWLRLAYAARLVPRAKVLSNQEETNVYSLGTATRFCWSDARWAPPNVSQCESMAFAMLRITVSNILQELFRLRNIHAACLSLVSVLS